MLLDIYEALIHPSSLSFHPPGFSILHKDGSLLSPMLPASYRARSLDFRSNVTNASSPARQTRFALSGCCRFLVYITSFFFSFAAPLFIRKSEDLFFTVATKSDSHALTRFLPPLPFLFDQHSTTMDLSRRPLKSCLSFLLENETFYFFFVFLFSFNTQINRCFVFAWPHYTRWEKRRRSSPQQLRRRAKRGRAGGVSTKEPLNRGLFSGASLAFKLEDVWR